MASLGVVAVTAALTGRATRAQEALRLMLALEPDMRLSNFAERYPLRRPEDVARWLGEEKLSLEDAAAMLKPFDPKRMTAWTVSKDVGQVRNQGRKDRKSVV